MMYIKEDLIIPHVRPLFVSPSTFDRSLTSLLPQHYTFYDFIINKYRGKSGPMFSFDVHDDVRLTHDAKVEKDEVRSRTVLLDPPPPLAILWMELIHEPFVNAHSLTRARSSSEVGTTGTSVRFSTSILPLSLDCSFTVGSY